MQGEERCGKTAKTCGKAVKTFVKIAVTSARTAGSFGMIDAISGRIFDQERARDRLRKTGGTFAKTGVNSGKIIGISDMIAKTGVETGETYGTTWLAAKATAVKYLWAREAGNNCSCCRLSFIEKLYLLRCSGYGPYPLKPFSLFT
jgi:hypothetical protein